MRCVHNVKRWNWMYLGNELGTVFACPVFASTQTLHMKKELSLSSWYQVIHLFWLLPIEQSEVWKWQERLLKVWSARTKLLNPELPHSSIFASYSPLSLKAPRPRLRCLSRPVAWASWVRRLPRIVWQILRPCRVEVVHFFCICYWVTNFIHVSWWTWRRSRWNMNFFIRSLIWPLWIFWPEEYQHWGPVDMAALGAFYHGSCIKSEAWNVGRVGFAQKSSRPINVAAVLMEPDTEVLVVEASKLLQ